jgi:hypothetical protein
LNESQSRQTYSESWKERVETESVMWIQVNGKMSRVIYYIPFISPLSLHCRGRGSKTYSLRPKMREMRWMKRMRWMRRMRC